MKKWLGMLALLLSIAAPSGASAALLLGQEPDASVIVERNGLEWVWGGPCAGAGQSCGVVQLHHDFQFATEAQWLSSFLSLTDLVSAFTNVAGGSICAATYFNLSYNHCDRSDAVGGYVWHSPFALDASRADNPAAETFLVRSRVNAVPEPGTLALLGIAFVAALGAKRRRSA